MDALKWKKITEKYEMEPEEVVYEILTGEMDAEEVSPELAQVVSNEFAEGKECAVLYDNIYKVKNRILERLNKENGDRDVEELMNLLDELDRKLCYKMFYYGRNL